jgi:hypothetical protein
MDAIRVQCAEKPRTIAFYQAKLNALLAVDRLASLRLDEIDESVVEAYVQVRTRVVSRRKKALSPGSINRELATLRRMLRLGHEWKEIQRIPRIRLLRGEQNREFVLSPSLEAAYLAVCPQPLSAIAQLLLGYGPTFRRSVQPGVARGTPTARRGSKVWVSDGVIREGKE